MVFPEVCKSRFRLRASELETTRAPGASGQLQRHAAILQWRLCGHLADARGVGTSPGGEGDGPRRRAVGELEWRDRSHFSADLFAAAPARRTAHRYSHHED